jgi:hypothetical protein
VLAAEPVSVAALVRHLRSHVGEEGYTVCMHVPGGSSEGDRPRDAEATTASVIVELGPGPDDRPLARWLFGSPCRSVYVPAHVGRELGRVVPWERFAALDEDARAALDELEASLASDVTDDDAWGPEAWARVSDVLDRVGAPAS